MANVVEFELRKNSENNDCEIDLSIEASSTAASCLHDAGALQESLPLFAENIFPDCAGQASVNVNPGSSVSGCSALGNSALKLKNGSNPAGRQDHLACAKRLSRAMRQIPTNSKQHIEAGRLVCHHLVAMLHDSPSHNLRVSSSSTK